MASAGGKKAGIIAAALYVAACIVLAVGAVLENDPVAFAPLIFMTMPFILVGPEIFEWADIPETLASAIVIVIIGAALNAIAIFVLVRWIARAVSGGRRR